MAEILLLSPTKKKNTTVGEKGNTGSRYFPKGMKCAHAQKLCHRSLWQSIKTQRHGVKQRSNQKRHTFASHQTLPDVTTRKYEVQNNSKEAIQCLIKANHILFLQKVIYPEHSF